MKLTISTNGMGVRPYGGGEIPECHDVADINFSRYTGDHDGGTDRSLVVLDLSIDQGLAVAYDLLYQAVAAGKLAGWNVQFPERS